MVKELENIVKLFMANSRSANELDSIIFGRLILTIQHNLDLLDSHSILRKYIYAWINIITNVQLKRNDGFIYL